MELMSSSLILAYIVLYGEHDLQSFYGQIQNEGKWFLCGSRDFKSDAELLWEVHQLCLMRESTCWQKEPELRLHCRQILKMTTINIKINEFS